MLAHAKDLIQKRYGFKDQYIEHDFRKTSEFLTYSRWAEMLELIGIEEAERLYREWELAAFEGWQSLGQNWSSKKQPPDFEKYKQQLGIRRPNLFINKTKKDEVDKAQQALVDAGFGSYLDSLKPQQPKT
jgi:hypothetical protein